MSEVETKGYWGPSMFHSVKNLDYKLYPQYDWPQYLKMRTGVCKCNHGKFDISEADAVSQVSCNGCSRYCTLNKLNGKCNCGPQCNCSQVSPVGVCFIFIAVLLIYFMMSY